MVTDSMIIRIEGFLCGQKARGVVKDAVGRPLWRLSESLAISKADIPTGEAHLASAFRSIPVSLITSTVYCSITLWDRYIPLEIDLGLESIHHNFQLLRHLVKFEVGRQYVRSGGIQPFQAP